MNWIHDDNSATEALVIFLATCPDKKIRDQDRANRVGIDWCTDSNWEDSSRVSLLAAMYAQAGDFPHAIEYQQTAIELADKADVHDAERKIQPFKDGKTVYSANAGFWIPFKAALILELQRTEPSRIPLRFSKTVPDPHSTAISLLRFRLYRSQRYTASSISLASENHVHTAHPTALLDPPEAPIYYEI